MCSSRGANTLAKVEFDLELVDRCVPLLCWLSCEERLATEALELDRLALVLHLESLLDAFDLALALALAEVLGGGAVLPTPKSLLKRELSELMVSAEKMAKHQKSINLRRLEAQYCYEEVWGHL